MSTDHKITHTHRHGHRRRHPDAIGRFTWEFHEHEHDHSSLAESFKVDRDPIHRNHFHVKENR